MSVHEQLGLKIQSLEHMSGVFLVVEPSKIIFIISKYYTQKEDRIDSILGTIVSPN